MIAQAPASAPPWAVVLGASEGTGAAIAVALARDAGLDVFGVHRGNHPASARAVTERIEATGRRCHLRQADAGTAEGAAAGVAELLEVAGPRSVKCFVHSIASGSLGRFAAGADRVFHPKQVQRTFDAMAHSFVYWTQALVARDLLAPGARLLGLTNPMPESLVHGLGLVSAAKAALEVYVRHLAMELGPLGHRVNLLKFGLVETRAIRCAMPEDAWPRVERRISSVTPAGRLAKPDEVAAIVPLLVRDVADWFNGATIDFSGGQYQSLLDPYFNAPEQW